MFPSRLRSLTFITSFLTLSILMAAQGRAEPLAPPSPRDWRQFPAIAQVDVPKDLYALGDIHGDYDRMVELLGGTHLVSPNPASPSSVQWTGGNSVLVITGDMIDKSDHALNVIALLRSLQCAAAATGGRVIATMGNHEADFLAASGADRGGEFVTELRSAGISPGDVATGRDSGGIGAWLRDLPIAAKVGDWFFCHAGNTGGLTLAQLDQQIQSQVNERGFACPILLDPNSLIQARMHPRPWWDWDGQPPALHNANVDPPQGADPATAGEQRLRTGIEAIGAHHLVFGHQPGKIIFADGTVRPAGAMYQMYDGLAFLIDTGMSRGVANGRGALLHIINGSVHGASAMYADGTTRTLVH